jgi:hypothetical protein
MPVSQLHYRIDSPPGCLPLGVHAVAQSSVDLLYFCVVGAIKLAEVWIYPSEVQEILLSILSLENARSGAVRAICSLRLHVRFVRFSPAGGRYPPLPKESA